MVAMVVGGGRDGDGIGGGRDGDGGDWLMLCQ